MSLPRAPHAVIFDMDGLLLDSETLYHAAVVAAAGAVGHDFPKPLFLQMLGMPWADNQHRLIDHFGDDFPMDHFRADASRRFREMAAIEVTLKTGVIEILDRLDELALPRAIATSSAHVDVQHHLGAHGLLDRFHTVVASGDYPRSKPNPDPYLVAAERLGVAPHLCLALEDSHNGVRAAAAAGMMTIMVPDMLEATDEMHDLCVRIAGDLHEVRGLLI